MHVKQKKNLLLIEDDFHIGEKLYKSAQDLEVIKKANLCNNLQDGMTELTKKDYDIIILDLSLPDGNGIELLKWLKEKQIKVDVFVFSMNIELKKICLKNGAKKFYDKSRDFELLISNIANAD
ncbi:response regulator [Polaribacter sp.]|uniref:response regulator n=1 Tax=Polaribacter sp. TaxID=1920175 RepID=UPI003F6BEC1F